jgi:hypothetical protein
MSDTNGTPAAWHGDPGPEAEDYTDEDAADFRADPCAVCGDTTVCASQAGERLCAEHGAREVRDGIPPEWDGDAPQWAEDGQLGPDGIDQAQAFRAEGAEDEPAPADHLVTIAQAVAEDVTRLSEVDLARVILTLKRTVVAAEIELGNHRDRARGDAALAQAAGEMAPRRPAEHAMACCTSAIGPVCRHRTTPVADALQLVGQAETEYGVPSAELRALRMLAAAVREHGIGADLAAWRPDCTDQACPDQACPEHPGHQGDEHTYEQHHSSRDHVGPGPCRCPG